MILGCCNKRYEERAVSRARFVCGLVLMGGVHGAFLVLLAVASPFVPRCRKVLPGYATFTVDALRSVLRRDRIRVGRMPSVPGVSEDACVIEDAPDLGEDREGPA